jgi:3-oxoacyl-[acyl-carrier-protein] synthase-3
MSINIKSVIVGTGSYVPANIITNDHFLQHSFYEKNGEPILRDNQEIITKFRDIPEIEERRYAGPDQKASDLGYFAAADAINSSGIDPETLDYIIIAHNFGDITPGSTRPDVLPTLGSRIKHTLGINNPDCVAYDLPFGCPGWLQGMIQADYFIRSGDARRILVVGTETLSRVTDPHDRDSMIFADGAGATILEGRENSDAGILTHKTQTHTADEAYYLYSGGSSNPDLISDDQYIKMDGRKIYEYALKNVPLVIQQTLEKAGTDISEVKKVLVHQANGKMYEAIRFEGSPS